MANENTPWLVTYRDSAGPSSHVFETLDGAVNFIREHRKQTPVLWRQTDFAIRFPDSEPEPPAPKKRAARRKRKDSPAGAESGGAGPSAASSPAGDAAEPVRAREQDGGAGAELRPAAISKGPALPCGGTRCYEKGGTEHHDPTDPGCGKLRRARAVGR